jgi:formylglycine-generating enzyme required for sulfatase activity
MMDNAHFALYGAFIIFFVIVILAFIIYVRYDTLKELRNRKILLKRFKQGPFDASAIERATHFFIPFKGQLSAPSFSKERQSKSKLVQEDLFNAVDKLIETDLLGRNLVILAGAGGGKTTFILNYFALREKAYLKKSVKFVVVPLSHPQAAQFISDTPEQEKTIIFLDALEEDPLAMAYQYERLNELLMMCKNFKRVILTCQSRFFKKKEERAADGGVSRYNEDDEEQKRIYELQKIYISPFDDNDITRYMKKLYPFWQFSTRKKAVETALKVPFLREHPLFLNYLKNIIVVKEDIRFIYQMYEIIIEAWLERESSFLDKDKLKNLSESFALELWTREGAKLKDRDIYKSLSELCANWKPKIYSLLIRDAEQQYKFAHRSIMEYFFIRKFLALPPDRRPRIDWTEVMKSFLLEKISHGTAAKKLQRVCLSGANLTGMKLIDYDFSDSNFERINLRETLVQKTNFQGVLFKGASLEASIIGRANITNAILFETALYQTRLGLKFVYIPEGWFMMGSPLEEEGRNPDERLHKVVIEKPFYMLTMPVTQKQWKLVMGYNPSSFDQLGTECPVENVSWFEAQDFVRKLNLLEEVELYRLPTEEEWEYACRAGSNTRFFFGNDESKLHEYAYFKDNANNSTRATASRKPNNWGLYDMLGNVWEWCADWYIEEGQPIPYDSMGNPTGEQKLFRGGSAFNTARDCRCANRRGKAMPDYKIGNIGFRIIKMIPSANSSDFI